jgi:hypothetical protein
VDRKSLGTAGLKQIHRQKKYFDCCAIQSCTAYFTSSSDLNLPPCTASFRGQKGKYRWVPNLANTADKVTTPILNPASVSPYDGLYEVGRCHAADTRQKATNHGVFFRTDVLR